MARSCVTNRANGHLSLVVLNQNETAQLGAEMAPHAARQRRDDGFSIRRQPALAAKANDVRTQHQILNNEAFIPFEPGTRRDDSLDDPFFVNHPLGSLVAAATAPAFRWLARLVHAARLDRRLDIRAALLSLQPGDLIAQRDDGPVLLCKSLQQLRNQSPQISERHAVDVRGGRHY